MRIVPLFLFSALSLVAAATDRPNIIFILADDQGYGELGCYGQTLIQTPNIDRMAAEGIRFTQFYAGSPVCAPSRSVLMTGQHTGHTRVRGNAGGRSPEVQILQAEDVTVASVLKKAGYATGIIGKWGLGSATDAGDPLKHGFDYHFGFLNQTHAHNHYPDFLWRNNQRVTLPNVITHVGEAEGTGYATKPAVYANDLFFEEAQAFIAKNKENPFFLYLALTLPHANNERTAELGDGNEVPDYGSYADRPWKDSVKGHAAMITRMDGKIGALLEHLKKLGLEKNTLVIFSSDNGAHNEGGPDYDPAFFEASGPLTGLKRSLFEGGVRVPLVARWPERIKAGGVSGHVAYFGDMMSTFAELAGTVSPKNTDSISIVPALLGSENQAKHDYLYWEFHENGVSQAVLLDGLWKAIRLRTLEAPIALFDLQNDIGERTDLSTKNPAMVARATEAMRIAHVDNAFWKLSEDGSGKTSD
ncbi:N-acetylgalactosamine-6-sulfatase [Nibricoccus aquaticus]|uniref:N-acetylgalactosamine-6-sulfatase n=1 Tax=Nibricoccus aquaticus TaxID=2576891 RepID=A0A290QF04_9BACT|nr:arylsulfatase [Nibricoccus aquaticus]ATC65820.1 N-acetylgalactosamine-6-sulfatase [Nibricoccus aquaticus]